MSPLKVLKLKDLLVIVLSASALQQDGIQTLSLLIFISIFSQFNSVTGCLKICVHIQRTSSPRLSVCIHRCPEVLHYPSKPSAQR